MSFAVLSDFSNKLKGSPALRDALAKRPDFLAVIGDLDHRNPATDHDSGMYPPQDAPLVLADLRAMHRDTRDFGTPIGSAFATDLIGQADSGQLQIPLYYGWDDHDYCTNNEGVQVPVRPRRRCRPTASTTSGRPTTASTARTTASRRAPSSASTTARC